MEPHRNPPILARIISLFIGVGSLLMLLRAAHLVPPHARLGPLTEQSIPFHIVYIAGELFSLIGAILLWRLKPYAAELFVASLVCSLVGMALVQHDTPPIPYSTLFNVIGNLIFAAICAYVWRVTHPSPTPA